MKMAKDPVCGMNVDERSTGLKTSYKGKTYYFCYPECKTAFERDPEEYVK